MHLLVFRIVNVHITDGYVRWSSPELLRDGTLTEKADVWAFSITCVEILTMGQLPWPLFDNDTVRHFILSEYFIDEIFRLVDLAS